MEICSARHRRSLTGMDNNIYEGGRGTKDLVNFYLPAIKGGKF